MTDPALTSAIDAGIRAHQRGDLAGAMDHYLSALAIDADHARALSLYGLALLHAGRTAEAREPLERAIERGGDQVDVQVNHARYLRATGEIDRAVETLVQATQSTPRDARVWRDLGEARIEQRDFAAAADALDEALQLQPGNLAIALRLARAHAAAGHNPAAFYALEHADKISPDAFETAEVRADMARFNNDWEGLATHAEKMIERAPENPKGWRDLSFALYERSLLRAALTAFSKVLELEGRTPANLVAYGRVALQAGLPATAGEAFDEAEVSAAADATLHAAQSERYAAEGLTEKALERAEQAVALDPGYTPAYPHLSALRRGKMMDTEIAALKEQMSTETLPPERRSMAAFVLGHHYDAIDDIENAFETYKKANLLAEAYREMNRLHYSPADMDARTQQILSHFQSIDAPAPEAGDEFAEKPTPIFLVGAPRSGATLAESVLGAHSRVFAGGELPAASTLLHFFLQREAFAGPLSEFERTKYLTGYWEQAPETDGAAFLTDTALGNIEAVGLIAHLFPDAPIIRIRRNPVETGFTIFRSEFTKHWAFTHDLELIAHYLKRVETLADYWSSLLGDRLVTVQYEDLASDFEPAARRLTAAAGLEWEPAQAERAAPGSATLSAVSVREPVELRSRAAAYGARLDPLREALERYGVDLETGALKG